MPNSITKWLAGMAFALLQLDENIVQIECQTCNIIGGLYADCVDKLLNAISLPDDLKTDIEVLNISYCQLERLSKEDFARFTNLKELIIAYATILNFPSSTFSALPKLEILNVTSTELGKQWPPLPSSLKRLVVEEFALSIWFKLGDGSKMDIASLHSLEELYMRKNNLHSFPNLSQSAPLTFIDLSVNPMSKLKYNDIAPFCNLKQLILAGEGNELILNEDENLHEQCCGVKMWLKTHDIMTDFFCAFGKHASKIDNCTEQVFDSKSNEAYDICMQDPQSGGTSSLFGLVINVFVSFALIIAILYLVWRYYRSHAVQIEKTSKDETVEEEAQVEENSDE